ncbi:hypothetical protein HDU98_006822 [Podochytrium sp. JEL0797]|nr:hypothetical protein HDU98_006822 [Podochytrium sp. JEL0797]
MTPPKLTHVAVIGAAGGLGQALVRMALAQGIAVTAIVRGRPERIAASSDVQVKVVPSLADKDALADAFAGADAVITATGPTATSKDASAFLSVHFATIEAAMLAANVKRIVMVNTLVTNAPGKPASWFVRTFKCIPGTVGVGAKEMQDVLDALGAGALSKVDWTLVRAAVNGSGADVEPVASEDWEGARNSMMPVSYDRMATWMLNEASANQFVGKAPLVSKSK